eukprot:18071-Eustigmatos_ZCMA.PRE.1
MEELRASIQPLLLQRPSHHHTSPTLPPRNHSHAMGADSRLRHVAEHCVRRIVDDQKRKFCAR